MKNNNLARYGTAAFVIGSIIGTYFLSRPDKKGVNTKLDRRQQKKIDQNLMTPANATFGIVWPILYSGTIALAIHQALPSQKFNPRYAKARPWLLVCYTMNAVFGYFFSKSDKFNRVGAAVTTIAMLPASIILHRQLEIGQGDVPEPENSIRKVMGMYAGWLTAASAVSITTLIQEMGYFTDKKGAKTDALFTLPITSGIGLLASKSLNDPYYLLTIIAALAGIAVKQNDTNPEVSKLAVSLALGLATTAAPLLDETGKLQEIVSRLIPSFPVKETLAAVIH
jgi:tryptophan-rich sensory protein